MPHLVCILELLNGNLYVGSTNNIERRVLDHGKGFGHKTTLLGGYKSLIHTESFPDRITAERRERQLKRWSHAKKMALTKGNFPILR